jgi:sulfide dehydrogenase cytochrome subunit
MQILKYTVIALLFIVATNAAAQDLQTQIQECEACHGPGGASTEDDIPSLAGMDAAELTNSLEEFYFYERHCTTTTYRYGDRPKTPLNMCNIANVLSEKDRTALGEYFARQ